MFSGATVTDTGVSHGGDASAHVRFYKYFDRGEECDFVEIIHPGDSRSAMRRRAQETDKHRWPGHWAAYERGEHFKASGYPLENWPALDPGLVRMLNSKHIYTVEQVAAVHDGNLAALGMGGRTLVDKAKAFMESRKDSDVVSKLVEQNEALKDERKLLQERMDAMSAQLQALADERSKPKETLHLKK